jgi:hypothetical protein
MDIHLKAKRIAAGLAFLFAVPIFAGEKVQITGSTSIELPKPNQILEDAKRSRIREGPSGRSEYEGGAIQASPLINSGTNPGSQRKLKDALDRQKNWIFANPYEMQFDNKTEEFLKGEKGTGLYNHRLMKTEEKGMVDRFLHEKQRDNEPPTGEHDSNDRTDSRTDHGPNQRPDFMAASLKDESGDNKSKPKLERGLSLPPALEEKTSELFADRNAFQKRMDSSPFSDTGLGSREKQRFGMTTEEREARDAELGKIYQPRVNGSTAPTVGGIDPVNRAFDSSQQEATPFSVRRSDQLNFGRADASNPSGRNSPIFSPGLVAPGSRANSDLSSRRSDFDFGSKAPSAAVAPSPVVTAPSSSAPAFAPAPFILPRPQRKF